MKTTLFALSAAAMFTASTASATVLVTETFSYPDGSLVGNGGWVNQSGTAGEFQVTSGEAIVDNGTGSEDPELVFANDLTTGIVRATFDIRVTSNGITGTDFEYFAHFSDDTQFNFRSRLDVVAPTGGGDYTLGIPSSSSTNESALTTDFTFGDTVTVVLEFDLDTGIGSVTAGGVTAFGSALGSGEILDTFNLRQSGSSSDEVVAIDNLVIEYIPEPSSLALLGLGGLFIARRRRG